jgi:DNA-binding NtrC family response regulator
MLELKAKVLIVDDDDALRRALKDRFEFWGCEVTVAADGREALAAAAQRAFDLILLDLSMPVMDGFVVLEKLRAEKHPADIVVLSAHGSVDKVVRALKEGAADFLTKPADFDLLEQVVEKAVERRKVRLSLNALAERSGVQVLAAAPAMKEVLATADRVAAADTTVIISGESGSGKQVVAEYIHARSPRRDGPFVYVNCVAISNELIESTLFGHEKGAFTGAQTRKQGRLEAAAGGTAFLDEIGDISSNLQTKLLHFLEAGEFERVGGNRTVRVDCRILAATNKDLAAEVAAGRFREDLFYRLNVISLRVPPLRERSEDIPLLGEAFLTRFATELKRGPQRLAPRTLEVMQKYSWPGNVRQLKNAMERMVVLAADENLTPDLLPPEVLAQRDVGAESPAGPDHSENLDYREAVGEFKRRLIGRVLDECGGNQTKAAEKLGLQRSYLNRLIKDLDLRND